MTNRRLILKDNMLVEIGTLMLVWYMRLKLKRMLKSDQAVRIIINENLKFGYPQVSELRIPATNANLLEV